ncbi:FhaA domain-containing protein [Desulfolucanica intricata]|uniref:FhaA domain-containing protein n=1 Tax=Desulfolucanica intricata TaxID=1285191 RepID=UPI0008344B1C|nr:DUF3662 and FHA domain-containing protein [Desulfolucanica intricata]
MRKVNFFDSLETRLEKYIEGIFKEKHCGNIQPVDIAKKLLREMKNGKRVSVNSVFVPNSYIISLNSKDFEALEPYITLLTAEMQDYLIKKARERKYTLVGSPTIIFQSKVEIEVGTIKVQGSYAESEKMMLPEENETQEGKLEKTQRFTIKNLDFLNGKREQVYLVIELGPDKNKSFKLNNQRVVIGRDESCDIVLSDKSVSRRHVMLERRRKAYVIRDLKSTNGTFVNGVRIIEEILKPGDEIKLGITICSVRAD